MGTAGGGSPWEDSLINLKVSLPLRLPAAQETPRLDGVEQLVLCNISNQRIKSSKACVYRPRLTPSLDLCQKIIFNPHEGSQHL